MMKSLFFFTIFFTFYIDYDLSRNGIDCFILALAVNVRTLCLKFYLQVDKWFFRKTDHSTYKEEKNKLVRNKFQENQTSNDGGWLQIKKCNERNLRVIGSGHSLKRFVPRVGVGTDKCLHWLTSEVNI
jgi:hypothetical protein